MDGTIVDALIGPRNSFHEGAWDDGANVVSDVGL